MRAVDKGAQLTINYNGDRNYAARLSFDAK